jgi:hypothetical protein
MQEDVDVTTTVETSGYMQVINEPCDWCSGNHLGNRCPYVKKIDYFRDGRIRSVEFFAPNAWPYPAYVPYYVYPYYPYSPYPTWTFEGSSYTLTYTNNEDDQTSYVYTINE